MQDNDSMTPGSNQTISSLRMPHDAFFRWLFADVER